MCQRRAKHAPACLPWSARDCDADRVDGLSPAAGSAPAAAGGPGHFLLLLLWPGVRHTRHVTTRRGLESPSSSPSSPRCPAASALASALALALALARSALAAAARSRLAEVTPSLNTTPESRARSHTRRISAHEHPTLSTAEAKPSTTSVEASILPMSWAARNRRRTPAGTPTVPAACRLTRASKSSPASAHWLVYARSAKLWMQPDAPSRCSISRERSPADKGHVTSMALCAA